MKTRKKARKSKVQSRDFTEQELGALMYAVTDERFNFSEYDLELVKNPNITKSSRSHGRAEVVIKKIKGMQKALAKQQWKAREADKAAKDSPFLTKTSALQSFVQLKEGQELGATIEVLSDLLIKNKLITQKGLDKLIQERLLEGRHPDSCPKCESFEGKKCLAIFFGEDKAVLAKAHYPELTGAKAKRVIACPNFKQKQEEPTDEKKNDGQEGTADNS